MVMTFKRTILKEIAQKAHYWAKHELHGDAPENIWQ